MKIKQTGLPVIAVMEAHNQLSPLIEPIGRKPFLKKWIDLKSPECELDSKRHISLFEDIHRFLFQILEQDNLELAYLFRYTVEVAGATPFIKRQDQLDRALKRAKNKAYEPLERLLSEITLELGLDYEAKVPSFIVSRTLSDDVHKKNTDFQGSINPVFQEFSDPLLKQKEISNSADDWQKNLADSQVSFENEEFYSDNEYTSPVEEFEQLNLPALDNQSEASVSEPSFDTEKAELKNYNDVDLNSAYVDPDDSAQTDEIQQDSIDHLIESDDYDSSDKSQGSRVTKGFKPIDLFKKSSIEESKEVDGTDEIEVEKPELIEEPSEPDCEQDNESLSADISDNEKGEQYKHSLKGLKLNASLKTTFNQEPTVDSAEEYQEIIENEISEINDNDILAESDSQKKNITSTTEKLVVKYDIDLIDSDNSEPEQENYQADDEGLDSKLEPVDEHFLKNHFQHLLICWIAKQC